MKFVKRKYRTTGALSLGKYPVWLARIIIRLLKRNEFCTVDFVLRGRSPKKGKKWGRWGSIALKDSRKATIYVRYKKVTRTGTFMEREEQRPAPNEIAQALMDRSETFPVGG